jgi:hypothetical protein
MTTIRHALQGMTLGAIATAMLGAAALHGGAFESRPPTALYAQATTASTPAPQVRVNLPFAYKGQNMPSWCAEDMLCFDGTLQDDRRWGLVTSALADALAEGPHPEVIPPTRALRTDRCYFAASTNDISCMSGWAANVKTGRWFHSPY